MHVETCINKSNRTAFLSPPFLSFCEIKSSKDTHIVLCLAQNSIYCVRVASLFEGDEIIFAQQKLGTLHCLFFALVNIIF